MQHKDLAAVVVTYKPTEDIIANVLQTASFVDQVIIIDNETSTNSDKIIKQITDKANNIKVIKNKENEGIAKALNQAGHLAVQMGYKWFLTLDDDSFVDPKMVDNLLEGYWAYPEKDKVLMLAPYYCYDGVVEDHEKYQSQPKYRIIPSTITSGSIMDLDCFKKIGDFDEGLFIDCVDDDYCLKLSSKGYQVLKVKDALIEHKLGDKKTFKWFGKTVYSDEHNYIRWYYITRNNMTMFVRYTLRFPLRNAHALHFFIKSVGKVVFLEEDKSRKIKSMFVGFKDFLIGKKGRKSF